MKIKLRRKKRQKDSSKALALKYFRIVMWRVTFKVTLWNRTFICMIGKRAKIRIENRNKTKIENTYE
jgi:hypothetical protein